MAYTDQLSSAGLQVMPLEDRIAELEANLKSDISPILDTSPRSVMGQFVRIFGERAQAIMELIRAVHSGQYPDGATGFSLTALSALTGTRRLAATRSTIPASSGQVRLAAGVTLPAGSVAHVAGNPSARFVTDAVVTNSGAVDAWVPCAFTAEKTGKTAAPANQLTVVAEPRAGWLGVRNLEDAVIGAVEETDKALRRRRESELQTGSTATRAILTALTQTEGVVWAAVLENDSDIVDAQGIPPHSIEAVIHAPTLTDAQIAQIVHEQKAGGIRAVGSIIVPIKDSQGFEHPVGITRATVVDVHLALDVEVDEETYAGDEALGVALSEWADEALGVGDDVVLSRLVAEAFKVVGVLDVTAIRIGRSASPSGTTNLAINWNELADLDSSRITVNPS